ncbi:hypothetical protein B0H11DRAFT_1977683 [Mycena galericulata]|nr:hypothetical protein B0H11DRAFT_1977683 [Mycena galericulata]
MYTKALQTTYFFDGHTVWEAETAKLKSRDVPGGRGNEPPVWSLIDSDASTFEPPDALLAYTFPIHAVSPNETRFKNWRKQNIAYRVIMDPWNMEDLLGWAQIDPRLRTYKLDYPDMRNLVNLCGPVPRDIVGELTGRSTEVSVSSELQNLTLPQLRKHLADITTSPADTSHRLIIISRHLNGRFEDNFVTDFKSLRVAELVYEKWRVLGEEEALLFYQLCRGNAESSFLAGWVFESLAINYISSEPLSRQVLLPLRAMCATPENLRYTDASTVPDPSPTEYDVLHVTAEGAVLQRADGTLIFRVSPLAPGSLVPHSRDVIHYTDIAKQPFSNHHLYVPKARNNPLFDAFFIDINDMARTIVVWILQITASKRHEGSSNGYPIIRKLKDRLADDRRGYQIQLKYVLVVPVLQCQVSWRLPEGWGPDVAGEVLVQYVDTTVRPVPQ